jgi:ferredoxin-nitrite reductase
MSKQELNSVEMNNKEDFESFNIREKLKKAIKPYDYYKSINSLDFDNLTLSDTLLLQDFGIYNNELNDEEFMLRLRFPAGRITNLELKTIALICKKYNLDIILTARAGIQIHKLDSSNILEIFNTLENIGINTWQSFGDNVRNITSDVFDGVGKYNIIEVFPYIEQMQRYILKNENLVGVLPRRLSTAISGSYANSASFFASDIYFALAKKDNIYGFNLYLGGKNTELAMSSNIFLQKDEVLDVFKIIINVFNKYGLRLDRERTRLFHLLEDIGMEKFRSYLQEEYNKTFCTKGETLLEKVSFDEYEKLKDGSFSFCYRSEFARLYSDELLNISNYACSNKLEVRIGIDQQLYLLNLKNNKITLENFNKNRTIIACAGSEYCPYAYWNIKDEISFLPLDKIEKHNLLLGFSGCLKGCAKHEHSDIGLVGLKSNIYGVREKTARIYIGALYTNGEKTAKRVFNTVPLNSLKEILSIIIDEFEESGYRTFEDFARDVLHKYSNSFLNLWFLAKFSTKKKVYLDSQDYIQLLEDNFKNESFIEYIEDNYDEAIKFLSHSLWNKKELKEDILLNKTYLMQA